MYSTRHWMDKENRVSSAGGWYWVCAQNRRIQTLQISKESLKPGPTCSHTSVEMRSEFTHHNEISFRAEAQTSFQMGSCTVCRSLGGSMQWSSDPGVRGIAAATSARTNRKVLGNENTDTKKEEQLRYSISHNPHNSLKRALWETEWFISEWHTSQTSRGGWTSTGTEK